MQSQQGSCLPQTGHASAFVVDPVEIFLTSGFITVQNLVVVSHTVCTHVTGTKHLEDAGTAPLRTRVWLTPHINTLLPTCVIILNFVALDQTVWAYIDYRGPKKLDNGARPLGIGT